MITELTENQKALTLVIRDKWINRFNSLSELDKGKTVELINFIYEIASLPHPKIIYVDSPMAAQIMANDLTRDKKEKSSKLKFISFGYGSCSDYGWVSFYDFFVQAGIIKHEKFEKFSHLLFESAVYDTITLDKAAIVVCNPSALRRHPVTRRMHCTTGPAIVFKDKYEQYYINGRRIPDKEFKLALSGITRQDFIGQSNAEIKAAWYEILGQQKMMEILGAKEISTGKFLHSNGDVETVTLYKTLDVFPEADDKPLAWVKFMCPSTGTNYLVDVESHHQDAKKAAISTSPLFNDEKDYSFTHRS